jgi:hypothetical protein
VKSGEKVKVLLIKNDFEDPEIILEVFKSLFKNMKSEIKGGYIAIYFTYDNNSDIIHILNALETELVGSIHAYISDERSEDRLSKEVDIAIRLMEELPIGVYGFKEALLKIKNIENKKEILNYILQGSGINETFILEFAENDLNVSQASKAMFIHRNTMIYKLNKLKANSQFDMTNFKDAYILYSLLENK